MFSQRIIVQILWKVEKNHPEWAFLWLKFSFVWNCLHETTKSKHIYLSIKPITWVQINLKSIKYVRKFNIFFFFVKYLQTIYTYIFWNNLFCSCTGMWRWALEIIQRLMLLDSVLSASRMECCSKNMS